MQRIFLRLGAFLLLFLLSLGLLPAAELQAAQPPPEVEAGAYVLMDASTGQVLAAKNANEMAFPASITKILTTGLILEQAAARPGLLEDQAVTSYRASHELIYGATHVGLQEGDVLRVNDLLYATQIESANDAANVLAEYSDGSLEAFAARMNQKAGELGLGGSNFTNPSGQPDPNHFTSAYDMAAITRWALGVPGFRELFASPDYPLPITASRSYVFTCQNNNPILTPGHGAYYEGVTGSKMGYTDDARYTMVTSAKRGDTELICVVMRCETDGAKYSSTRNLLDYGFENFSPAVYSMKGVQPVAVPVFGGGAEPLGEITVVGGQDVTVLLPNGMGLENVVAEYAVPEKYVIGQPFSPVLRLLVNKGAGAEELATVPLSWTGFDEMFAANTPAWERVMKETPPVVLILVAVLLALVAVVVGRIFYVKYKRHRRRQARLEAARARQPISIAPRPEALPRPAHLRGVNPGRARQMAMGGPVRPAGRSGGHTPYVYGSAATQPRRVGRAAR